MKFSVGQLAVRHAIHGRSREGAWIEIGSTLQQAINEIVAPVRERGLKWCHRNAVKTNQGRSRKGTWIEIRNTVGFSVLLTQMMYSD